MALSHVNRPDGPPGNKALVDNITRFLKTISPDDIFSVLKTSTSGLITASTVPDAIDIIIRYSDPATLLHRRKITVEYLTRFLHSENVPMKLPADKNTLSAALLRHWNVNRAQPEQTRVSSTSTPQDNFSRAVGTPNNNITSAQVPNYPDYHEEVRKELGISFTKWFYTMLNTLNDFEEKHFWATCSLRVEAISGNSIVQEAINDGPACCQLLRTLVEVEKIVFQPNLINGLGVICVIDTYGLVKVKVAGTVQVLKPGMSLPGGVFEQVFGLMKDATADDNYKVKYSVLRLRAALNAIEFTELSNAIMNTPVVIEEVTD